MKKKSKFLKHSIFISLFSSIIAALVSSFLTAYFTRQNIYKQSSLDLYKDLIHQQSEFVDHLSKDIQSRLHKLSAYFDSVEYGDKLKANEYWVQYREATMHWSAELKFYLTNLDRYFPHEEYTIGKYIIATDLFKNHLQYSFRQILEQDLQPRFVKINNEFNELNRNEAVYKELDNGKEFEQLKKEIDYLYKRVYEFTEGLSKASTYYKISTKTKLSKENF
jgi:hypothetical protein